MRTGKRALLLDALGTTLALEPPAPALRALLAERFGVEVTLEAAQRAIAAEIAYYRAHIAEGRDRTSVDALRGRCAGVLREALAAERVLESVGADSFTRLLLDALQFRPFPEVGEVLARVRAAGVAVVITSNWDASLPDTLRAVGLGGAVDGVVTSAAIGAAKPERAIFRAALALVDAGPEDALHVGDSLAEDVEGARGAGIDAALVVRSGPAPRAAPPEVPIVTSLAEVPALLGLT